MLDNECNRKLETELFSERIISEATIIDNKKNSKGELRSLSVDDIVTLKMKMNSYLGFQITNV